MRRTLILLAVCFALVLGWYAVWYGMTMGDVARVKTSIAFQNQRFKTTNRYMELKADSVAPAGFPFHFRVSVVRPTLSMISGNETYAVSIPELTLEPMDSDEGRYRVQIPATIDAMYAVNGSAPESYVVTMAPVPAAQLRAQGDSTKCSNFPGNQRCTAVAGDAPLVTIALQLPQTIILHMQLNGESKDASFTMMALDMPIFNEIPADMSQPLQLFVGVLREALVYHTK